MGAEESSLTVNSNESIKFYEEGTVKASSERNFHYSSSDKTSKLFSRCQRPTVPQGLFDHLEGGYAPERVLPSLIGSPMAIGAGDNKDSRELHIGVQCQGCQSYNITGNRYKCGVCNDFDLCEKCAIKTTHDRTHIFIKIRKPVTEEIPSMRLLSPAGVRLGEEMCFDTTDHNIPCAECGKQIKGLCFKCGACKNCSLCQACEKQSPTIHDPDHVFMVLPYPSDADVQQQKNMVKLSLY